MSSSSSSSLTQKWLLDNVHSYPQSFRVYSDIDSSLSRFLTLRPKSDVYTYDDGRTQLLLCVHGLLPISFRSASYNIPIAVWITREYPRLPPIPYVVPTNDMLVKPSDYVDTSGRCSIEYVRHWEKKNEGCNLLGLIESMQDQFSREPPLYSKPKNLATPPLVADPPILPPKPGSSTAPTSNPSPGSPPLVNRPPPPLPTGPPQYHPSIPSPLVGTPVPAPPLVPQSSTPVRNLLDEEALDIQSAQSNPPPRPPNPELLRLHAQVYQKFITELGSFSQAMALDAERLGAHQIDLLSGEPAIRDEMSRLEAVRDVCRTVSGRIRGTVEQSERNIAELRRKGDPEVDELVCSTTIVHNQLINLVAEDNAIEDTIYHLHRALNTGRVDLERFLRITRVLAEEQFMKRALIGKIKEGMPPTESNWS